MSNEDNIPGPGELDAFLASVLDGSADVRQSGVQDNAPMDSPPNDFPTRNLSQVILAIHTMRGKIPNLTLVADRIINRETGERATVLNLMGLGGGGPNMALAIIPDGPIPAEWSIDPDTQPLDLSESANRSEGDLDDAIRWAQNGGHGPDCTCGED